MPSKGRKPRKPRATGSKTLTNNNAQVRIAEIDKRLASTKASIQRAELAALRAEVRRKQRNAAAKIRRLKALKGLDVSGYDPRVSDFRKIGKYTAKQLITYAKKLDEFTNRDNQFVATPGGPVKKTAYERYMGLREKHNALVQARINENANIPIPGTGMTIGERDDTFTYTGKRANGVGAEKPYYKVNSDARNINGPEALERMSRQLEKKLSRKYLPKVLRSQRNAFRKALDIVGSEKLKEVAKGLTNNQFDILFNETGFAKDFFNRYGVISAMAAGTNDKWYSSVVEDGLDEIIEAVEWAKTLPKTRDQKGPRKRRG